jgi:hypothetical protein
LKLVLGKSANDPVAQDYKKTFFNGLVEDTTRNTCSFKIDEDTFPVEELVGMQLAHAKSQAEKHGGDAVFGAVISVIQSKVKSIHSRSLRILINLNVKQFSMLQNSLVYVYFL